MRARIDPRLSVHVVGRRELPYTTPAELDRPAHVRAASGLACDGDRIYVIQDDASYIAELEGDRVSAIPLPAGPGGHRRFEAALANKHDKLDLECGAIIGGELWAFGSGSTPQRERIVRLRDRHATVLAAPALYAAVRAALHGMLNVEGVAVVQGTVWLFHRGNCGPADQPAIVRLPLAELRDAVAREVPPPALDVEPWLLGSLAGHPLGFTDAATDGDHVFFLAAAEGSANAVDDGPAAGSQLGVIGGGEARTAALVAPDGTPIKAEGLAIRGERALVAIDPDDVAAPAILYELELVGPWR